MPAPKGEEELPASAQSPLIYAALVHFPVIDKHGDTVTTSVTNLDIHDISRSARTFGIRTLYLVTPVEAQHWLVQQVLRHWNTGWGSTYNPNRKDALANVKLVTDIGAIAEQIASETGSNPLWITTSARKHPHTVSYPEMRTRMEQNPGQPMCILFGTGWGLHPEVMIESDVILEPVYGAGDYNHLSVRAAAAIIFDRLLGR